MGTTTYNTVGEAVRGLAQRGFAANLELSGAGLRAVGTDTTYRPDDLTIIEHYRFEGASDPEELGVVYAIEAADGTRGVVVDAYGVYANPDLSAFLKSVKYVK